MSSSASVEATRPPSFSLKHAIVVLVHVEKLHMNPSLFRIMQSSHPPKDLFCVEIVQYYDAMLKGFVTKATNNRRMVRLAREV